MSKTNKTAQMGRAVLVTTTHRGVFFGYFKGEPKDIDKARITIDACRVIVYWDTETHGFMGLAASGPTNGCRVSKPAGDESVLFDVTGVFACTPEATKRFEEAPWAR